MTDDTASLILEHLRGLRNELTDHRREVRHDLGDIRQRVQSLEVTVGQMRVDVYAVVGRLDLVDGRIARIEERLELREATD